MKILKFGGSSVASAERITALIDILVPYIEGEERFAVVCSAFGGVTDMLIDMSTKASKADLGYIDSLDLFQARHKEAVTELIKSDSQIDIIHLLDENYEVLKNLLHGVYLVREVSPRTMDYVLSFGERTSNFIIAAAMKERGYDAHYLDARQIIKTNKDFGSASVVIDQSYKLINEYFDQHPGIHIVTGFIATDVGGLTTTLGRGGSDYTAALLAGALDASVLEIWTDVDGVLTTDPRKVKKAYSIKQLSYNEAMEMSHFGAKVIYPPTIQPALEKKIPLYIKNTFNPTHPGTRIDEHVDPIMDDRKIKGISAMSDISLITLEGTGMIGIPGIAARLFGSLANQKINIILITQASSEHSICFAVNKQQAKIACSTIEREFEKEIEAHKIKPVKLEKNLSILAVIGENMRNIPGIAGKLFSALGKNGVNVVAIAQGSSELNISFVISAKDQSKALNLIHDSLFLSASRTLHVFLMGVGLIGKTLLSQIKEQHSSLIETQEIDIKIIGVANSRKMHFDPLGMSIGEATSLLEASLSPSSIDDFVSHMIDMNLPNSIFVDCTASKDTPSQYASILQHNISITTPNKVATSSSQSQYDELKEIAKSRHVEFMYETNVGAGLPVLSTLKSLLDSGDQVLKIEAVLSGTLSYIFNTFSTELSFSNVVKQAKDEGYTEPDPREDLSGTDVARKIIILGRELGLQLELSDVDITALLSSAATEAKDVPTFFEVLEKENNNYQNLIKEAEASGKKLRFIATLENGKARASLQAVESNNPFASLEGSDNMIVFTTRRYKERPLVIKGPGAGAEVTAAGVFAEMISLAQKM